MKRQEKGRDVKNNSASYLALDLTYIPDFLTISDRDNVNVAESFSIIPKWGIRRSISSKLFFEFAFGIGYSWGENRNNDTTAGLDLKIGYSF